MVRNGALDLFQVFDEVWVNVESHVAVFAYTSSSDMGKVSERELHRHKLFLNMIKIITFC